MKERTNAIPPFGVRMPSDVKAWIERKAEQMDRSQNYVIVKILKEHADKEAASRSEAQ